MNVTKDTESTSSRKKSFLFHGLESETVNYSLFTESQIESDTYDEILQPS